MSGTQQQAIRVTRYFLLVWWQHLFACCLLVVRLSRYSFANGGFGASLCHQQMIRSPPRLEGSW